MARGPKLLGRAIAEEAGVALEAVALLRHFDGKLRAIERAGASIEEFTLTQPADTPYDFRAAGRPPVEVVAVIAGGRLHAVYRIKEVERAGSNRAITSASFRALDGAQKYPERKVKRFAGEKLPSRWTGGLVQGWSNPRLGIARPDGKLFGQVQIAAPSEP